MFVWVQLRVSPFSSAKLRDRGEGLCKAIVDAGSDQTKESDLCSPLVPNDYFCKDTFSFVSQIKNTNLSKKFLVSYDVTSLFTNIPLQETIGLAANLIFNHNPNLNITKKSLKNFSFCYITDFIYFKQ